MKKKEPLFNSNYIDSVQRILVPIIFIASACVIGCLGYLLIEKMSFVDAFYLALSTIFLTVSYIETIKLSTAGKIFTMFFLVFGVFSLFYAVGTIIEFIVEGNIIGLRRKRKMEKLLEKNKQELDLQIERELRTETDRITMEKQRAMSEGIREIEKFREEAIDNKNRAIEFIIDKFMRYVDALERKND